MIRWLPVWARRWLRRQLDAAERPSVVVAAPALAALWRVRPHMLRLIELLSAAGYPHAAIVDQAARLVTTRRPEVDPELLRAGLAIWVADELDEGALPHEAAPTIPEAPRALAAPDLEDLDDEDDATGELPMPSEGP